MKHLTAYKIFESVSNIFYHGSTDKDLAGKKGIHVGTYQAAKEALEARIGVPAEGEWDGTREYGKTLLAGKKSLAKPENKWKSTGYNPIYRRMTTTPAIANTKLPTAIGPKFQWTPSL